MRKCEWCGGNITNFADNTFCSPECAFDYRDADVWLKDVDNNAEDHYLESRYDEQFEYDDGMDGDHESALGSAGFGNDEYYGYAEDVM